MSSTVRTPRTIPALDGAVRRVAQTPFVSGGPAALAGAWTAIDGRPRLSWARLR